jgi:hypothetical protein
VLYAVVSLIVMVVVLVGGAVALFTADRRGLR